MSKIDWKQVAEALDPSVRIEMTHGQARRLAADICERMARGELVERTAEEAARIAALPAWVNPPTPPAEIAADVKALLADGMTLPQIADAITRDVVLSLKAENERLRQRVAELEDKEFRYRNLIEACLRNCDRRTLDNLATVTQDRNLLVDP